MAETWIQTFRTEGSFVFTALKEACYRFHVIGSGGDGARGANAGNGQVGNGGNGGAGGGYAIHQVYLKSGETAAINVSEGKIILTCNGDNITATAGSSSVGGTATGGNVSNLSGANGGAGQTGTIRVITDNERTLTAGKGGNGASSRGKYQADGAAGGDSVYIHFYPPNNRDYGGGNKTGRSSINTDKSIGGAGGGGSGGVAGNLIYPGDGGYGQLGGVVVETVTNSPTAPSWVEVENAKVVFGMDISVKWGTSTDLDGDLSGYTLERSVNSGTWTELYKGSMRELTDVPTSDWQTVQYRVKAYDGENQASGYISTTKFTVIQNSPPSAAGTLHLPDEIRGGSTITISWGRATDVDNNLAGYVVEQSINSGAWVEIANTMTLAAEVPITFGWATVQFRVRAYDAYGALGEYVTSELATIINNRLPVISGEDVELGTMVSSFAPQTYAVTDEDGDAVRVVENLDGTEKKAFDAVLGDENTLAILPEAWRKILNGKHTFRIIATDAQGAAVTRQMTFTKQEGQICFTLTQPLAADAMPERCILSIQGAFPVGSALMIEVCNNAFDEAPVWDDITNKVLTGQKHYFANTEKTAEQWGLGVRVSLNRGTAVGDCYIHSIRGNYA